MKKLARFKWAVVLALLGITLILIGVVSLARAFRNSGSSVRAPGETIVTIAKPGAYTLWQETKTIIDGKFMTFPDDLPPGVTITVQKQNDGTPVSLNSSGKSSTEFNGIRRVSVGQFTFANPGEYKIVVTGLDGKRNFYLDEAKFLKAFLSMLIYGAGGAVFLFAALAVGIYVAVRMSKQASE